MPRYELYHTLNQNIAKKDLKRTEKEELKDVISSFSTQESQALYNLIIEDRAHSQQDHDSQDHASKELPYGGVRLSQKSVEFDLADFPIRLRRIMYKFAKIVQKNEQYRISS